MTRNDTNNDNKEWWKAYFNDEWQYILRQVRSQQSTHDEATLIEAILQENNYQTVLDVPSGEGRIALQLAQLGYQVHGIEYNSNAVKYSQQQAAQQSLTNVTFEQGDMRTMQFSRQFDMVICMFNSFGYFNDNDNEQFIQSAATALKQGGTFIIDAHTLESLLPIFTPKEFWQYEDYTIFENRNFDYTTSRLKGHWTVIKNGEMARHYHSNVRIYGYKELTTLLQKYGFTQFEAFGNYYGEPFELGDDGMILLARKQ